MMKLEKLRFHAASRKPFEGEEPIIDAVKRAQKDIAALSGAVEGSALFRIASHITARPSVVPQAVDILRGQVEQVTVRINALATENGVAAQKMIDIQDELARQIRAQGKGLDGYGEKVQSGIGDAREKLAASLARLNA